VKQITPTKRDTLKEISAKNTYLPICRLIGISEI
jgi:hypothetical protein